MEDIKNLKESDILQEEDHADGQTGLEGCIFFHINAIEIPIVLLEEPTTPIHLPTLWTKQRTLCVHKTTLPYSCLSEGRRNSLSDDLDNNNILILGRMAKELNHNFALVKHLLTSLEFLVNEDKSVLGPTLELETDKKIKSLISLAM